MTFLQLLFVNLSTNYFHWIFYIKELVQYPNRKLIK